MSYADMVALAQREWEALAQSEMPVIRVGTATCGRSAGALRVTRALREELAMAGIEAHVVEVGCVGLCYAEPLVTSPSRHVRASYTVT
jgi:NADH-quinone oxidoreductase subunit F